MSKAIRWQVFFKEAKPEYANPKQYRVDIYDEQDSSWSGITELQAGDTPFVTDEDNSEDFFAPIRTQTGTLQICTKLPSGGMIKLEDILPSNNTQRPMRLLRYSNGSYSVIEWQGFLSCEAYSQAYIGTPENISIPVIGILEAMDSISVSQNDLTDVMYLYSVIGDLLAMVDAAFGSSVYQYIYYSRTAYRIFQAGVETNIFFEEAEILQENSVTYATQGISCKAIIERLCTFMGWVCRDSGVNIYFQRINEELGWYKDTIYNFTNDFHTSATTINTQTLDMGGLSWMGTGHQRSVTQGANRVEVVAKLSSDDVGLKMPDTPMNDMTTVQGQQIQTPDGEQLVTLYPGVIAEQNDQYYSNCQYRYYSGASYFPFSQNNISTSSVNPATRSLWLQNTYMWGGDISEPRQQARIKYAGAALVRFYLAKYLHSTYNDIKNGLYCTFLPNIDNASNQNPIFTIKTSKIYTARLQAGQSRLKIKGTCYFIGHSGTLALEKNILTSDIDNTALLNPQQPKIQLGLRWGDEVVNSAGTGWERQTGTDLGRFYVDLKGNGFEATVPVAYSFNGDMELAIYPDLSEYSMIDERHDDVVYELIITDLSVTQEFSDYLTWKDTDENKYIRILGTDFRDQISVETDIVSDNNNRPAGNVLFRNLSPIGGLLQKIYYSTTAASPELRKPELDLLTRLAAYYSAARQRLELECGHVSFVPLPLLKLNGINDGKVYLPLSESRDWRTDVCTLTCFEMPQ